MSYAPIIIFAYNRLESLRRSVESLLKNSEAANSELFVFIDGAKSLADRKSINEIERTLCSATGFQRVVIHKAVQNIGLSRSIISGVTRIIKEYGRVIILEDDLIYSSNFLSFMNQGLERYRDEPRVFSICGYSNLITLPKGYAYDAYLCARSSSWGWATWSDRWGSVDWELADWQKVVRHKRAFNMWGGSDCFDMLRAWREGRNDSWAIRFCYAQFQQDSLSVFPILSKVQNDGFDGSGTHCGKYSRFSSKLDLVGCKEFQFPPSTHINNVICRSAMSYHSIIARILSKIISILR